MFNGCTNLKYINMKNFNEKNLDDEQNNYFDLFNNVPEDVVVCINETNNKNKIFPQIKQKKCYNLDCSDDWKTKKIISPIDGCSCELDDCLSCPPIDFGKEKCVQCHDNYYQKENEGLINNKYRNCYKEPKGYYLDKNDSLYKQCHIHCELCDIKGNENNHNCIKCKKNYFSLIMNNNYMNCYDNCSFYHYFDAENISYCTLDFQCPEEFPKLIEEKSECVKDEINTYESSQIFSEEYYNSLLLSTLGINKINLSLNFLNNFTEIIFNSNYSYNNYTREIKQITRIVETEEFMTEYNDINEITDKIYNFNYTFNDIKELIKNLIKNETEKQINETEYYNDIIKNIESIFTSGSYNKTKIDNGEDETITIDKMTIAFTSLKNQKNNKIKNVTTLELGNCENLLRNYYNLSDDEIIYLEKIDIEQEGMKIQKIEYDVFSKLSGNQLERLNLSVCEDSKIYLSIPIILSEGLDILNSSSDYYNDKCYTAKSGSGTDIIITDRKKEFIEDNRTVCQEDCVFYEYDNNIKKANCSCQIKDNSNKNFDMNINMTKLNENFGEENNKMDISNLGITSCNVLTSKENIESNAGFYSLLFILIIFIIIFIIFCTKGYNILENKFDEVIYKKFKNESKDKINKKNKIKTKKESRKDNVGIRNQRVKRHSFRKSFSSKNNFIDKVNNPQVNNPTCQNEMKNSSTINNTKLKPDTDYELNWLTYEEALRYDKRSGCEYYGSLIRSKQLFIFTFCSFNDYNSAVLKKFILFLSFALHYTVNALFFNESNIHQIYEDKGKYNFGYQATYIFSSAIISIIILRIMLQTLILTDKDVLEVKQQLTKNMAINMKIKKLKCMKIKLAIFFVLNFILLVLFWYYLTCFNAVYQNTQIYLIENTFISFGFSLIYPFIINILPVAIRMCSIHSSNKDQRYCYILSQIIQLI